MKNLYKLKDMTGKIVGYEKEETLNQESLWLYAVNATDNHWEFRRIRHASKHLYVGDDMNGKPIFLGDKVRGTEQVFTMGQRVCIGNVVLRGFQFIIETGHIYDGMNLSSCKPIELTEDIEGDTK